MSLIIHPNTDNVYTRIQAGVQPTEEEMKNLCLNKALYYAASGNGLYGLMNFLREKGACDLHLAMQGAMRGNDQDLAEYYMMLIYETEGEIDWNYAFYGAAEGGHMELVDWVLNQSTEWDEDYVEWGEKDFLPKHKPELIDTTEFFQFDWDKCLYYAVIGKNMDIINLCLERDLSMGKKGVYWLEQGIQGAAYINNIPIIEFLLDIVSKKMLKDSDYNLLSPNFEGLKGALEGQHDDLVEYFEKKIKDLIPSSNRSLLDITQEYLYCARYAGLGDNLPGILYLEKRIEEIKCNLNFEEKIIQGQKWPAKLFALFGAAEGGHIDLMRKFEHRVNGYGSLILQCAALGGCLQTVQYVEEKYSENYNSGMKGACDGGHLTLIEYFEKKIEEKESKEDKEDEIMHMYDCMEKASAKGHLSIVMYLAHKLGLKESGLFSRPKSDKYYLRSCIEEAARSDRRRVVDFLRKLCDNLEE